MRKKLFRYLTAAILTICFVLPAVLSWIFCQVLRKWGWIGEQDLKLEL